MMENKALDGTEWASVVGEAKAKLGVLEC